MQTGWQSRSGAPVAPPPRYWHEPHRHVQHVRVQNVQGAQERLHAEAQALSLQQVYAAALKLHFDAALTRAAAAGEGEEADETLPKASHGRGRLMLELARAAAREAAAREIAARHVALNAAQRHKYAGGGWKAQARRMIRHRLRWSAVPVLSTLSAFTLITVGFVHPALFTMLASLVWFSLHAYVSYVPLHLCATSGLTAGKRRVLVRYAAAVPLTCTVLEAALRVAVGTQTAYVVANGVLTFGSCLFLPAVILYQRRRAGRRLFGDAGRNPRPNRLRHRLTIGRRRSSTSVAPLHEASAAAAVPMPIAISVAAVAAAAAEPPPPYSEVASTALHPHPSPPPSPPLPSLPPPPLAPRPLVSLRPGAPLPPIRCAAAMPTSLPGRATERHPARDGARVDAPLQGSLAEAKRQAMGEEEEQEEQRERGQASPQLREFSISASEAASTVRAIMRVQARFRRFSAGKRVGKEIRQRRKALTQVAWPMIVATLLTLGGGTALVLLTDEGSGFHLRKLPKWLSTSWYFCFGVPSLVILLVDLCRGVRFSLAHAVFFVTCLQPCMYVMADFTSEVREVMEGLVTNSSSSDGGGDGGGGGGGATTLVGEAASRVAGVVGVRLLVSLFYMLAQTLLAQVAMLTLQLMSLRNTFSQLLFPFQFFDFAFFYGFFLPQSYFATQRLSTQWALQVLLQSCHILVRNGGYYESLVLSFLRRFGCYEELLVNDPIIRIQFLARLALQYSLADVSAVLAVPTLVSLFVWRDGSFYLPGSQLTLDACSLTNLWYRFLLLLPVKWLIARLTRCLLEGRMAHTLLGGKLRGFGASDILAEQRARRTLRVSHGGSQKRSRSSKVKPIASADQKASPLGAPPPSRPPSPPPPVAPPPESAVSRLPKRAEPGTPVPWGLAGPQAPVGWGAPDVSTRSFKLVRMSSSNLRRMLNLNDEHQKALQGLGELSISWMNYKHMASKLLKSNYRYFVAVVLYELFAVFTPDESVPHRHSWRYDPAAIAPANATNLTGCESFQGWAAARGTDGWLLAGPNFTETWQ